MSRATNYSTRFNLRSLLIVHVFHQWLWMRSSVRDLQSPFQKVLFSFLSLPLLPCVAVLNLPSQAINAVLLLQATFFQDEFFFLFRFFVLHFRWLPPSLCEFPFPPFLSCSSERSGSSVRLVGRHIKPLVTGGFDHSDMGIFPSLRNSSPSFTSLFFW